MTIFYYLDVLGILLFAIGLCIIAFGIIASNKIVFDMAVRFGHMQATL